MRESRSRIDGGGGAGAAPLRVLLACDHIDHDGALHGGGRQIVELARGFDPERVRATVVVRREPSELGRRLLKDGLPFTFLGHGSFDPRTPWSLLRTIRRRGIQILHLTDFAASTFGRLAGRMAGVPAIVHVRSHHSEYQPRGFPPYVEWAYRALAPLTARAIAISHSVESFAVEHMGFRPDQVEVLNNPLARFSFTEPPQERVEALRRRYDIPPGAPVVGAVTRFHAAKGIRYLVEAFPRVLAEASDAWLVLVGEGPERGELEELAARLGVAERVLFTGFRRDVGPHYALFTVSTVPSVEEGFGNVAVEAMALGTPVVASDLGGLREIVTHGEDGLLVPPADPEALASAILALVRDPERRRRIIAAGRERSRDFSLDRYLERLEDLYRRVLANGGGGPA